LPSPLIFTDMRNIIKRLFDYRANRPVSKPRTFEVQRLLLDEGTHTTNMAIMIDHLPGGVTIETEVVFYPFGCAMFIDGRWKFYDKQGKDLEM